MKLLLSLLAVLAALPLAAADIRLGWDPSGSTNVGYKLYQAVGNSMLGTNILTTTNTMVTLTNVVPAAYRWWVTAYSLDPNDWQLESDPSNVVIVPDPIKPNPPILWFMFLRTP